MQHRRRARSRRSSDRRRIEKDGFVDLFTSDMLSPTLAGQQQSIPTHTPLQKPVGLSPERTQWMRNMLHLARGDGTWAQIGDFAGVTATDWTWGSAFLDVDLDGYEDLLTVNGHRYDVRAADPYDRIRNSFPRVPWNRESAEFPALHTRSVAFRNGGDLAFHDVSQAWQFGADTAGLQAFMHDAGVAFTKGVSLGLGIGAVMCFLMIFVVLKVYPRDTELGRQAEMPTGTSPDRAPHSSNRARRPR